MHCLSRTLLYTAMLFLVALIGSFLGVTARADNFEYKKPAPKENTIQKQKKTARSSLKKDYQSCPPGTQQIGKGPPESRYLYCKMTTQKGAIKHGTSVSWHANGKKKYEGRYINDQKDGTWTTFSRGGRKVYAEEYVNGELVKKVHYDKYGNPTPVKDPKQLARERREKRLARLGKEPPKAKEKEKKTDSWYSKKSKFKSAKSERTNWN